MLHIMKMFMRILHILYENVYEIVTYSGLINSHYENVYEILKTFMRLLYIALHIMNMFMRLLHTAA
jgi:hypothetical protein